MVFLWFTIRSKRGHAPDSCGTAAERAAAVTRKSKFCKVPAFRMVLPSEFRWFTLW